MVSTHRPTIPERPKLLSDERHPDARLLAEAHEALSWWETVSPSRPTSSLTGGGAIHLAEEALSDQLNDRPVLAMPSATFALLTALRCAGVGPGDEVLVSGLDWPAARAVSSALGAIPIPVPVRTLDLTMDPDAVVEYVGARAKVAVVTHLNGLVADVPEIRRQLPSHITLIEDCAQALGSRWGDQVAGTLADFAVFSLGPGKTASAGEMGLLVSSSQELHKRAVALSQHPIRQLLEGVAQPAEAILMGRPAPLAAILAAYALKEWADQVQHLLTLEEPVRAAIASSKHRLFGSPSQSSGPGRLVVATSRASDQNLSDLVQASCTPGTKSRLESCGGLIDPDLSEVDKGNISRVASSVRIVCLSTPTSNPTPNRRPMGFGPMTRSTSVW